MVEGSAPAGVRRHRVAAEHAVRAAPADGVRRRRRPAEPAGRAPPAAGRARRADRPGRARRGRRCSTPPVSATAITSSPATPGSCWPTSGRSRRTSGRSIGGCASRSPAGRARRAPCSTRSLASRSSIAESDQGRSFQALYRLPAVAPAPERAQRPARPARADRSTWRTWTLGCGTCTSTGSTPASAPRARSGCCRSSCGGSSTTRCGWRTDGSSSCCAASRRTRWPSSRQQPLTLTMELAGDGGRGRPPVRTAALRAGRSRRPRLRRRARSAIEGVRGRRRCSTRSTSTATRSPTRCGRRCSIAGRSGWPR